MHLLLTMVETVVQDFHGTFRREKAVPPSRSGKTSEASTCHLLLYNSTFVQPVKIQVKSEMRVLRKQKAGQAYNKCLILLTCQIHETLFHLRGTAVVCLLSLGISHSYRVVEIEAQSFTFHVAPAEQRVKSARRRRAVLSTQDRAPSTHH